MEYLKCIRFGTIFFFFQAEDGIRDKLVTEFRRVLFRSLLLRLGYALDVFARVLELQRVDRQHFRADLEAAVGVEQRVEPRPRREPLVVAAFRADVEVLLEVGAVEHRVAGRAFRPQAFGHGLARARPGALDLRRQQLLQPAHRWKEASSACLMGFRNAFTRATAPSALPASIS